MARADGRRCLVVGAGFLGGHVARRLADDGHRVTVLSRSVNPWLAERMHGIDVHLGTIDHCSPELDRLVRDADAVLHFASASKPPTAAASPAQDVASMVLPALAVMEALERVGEGRTLVLASSGGTVYGAPDELPTPEDHPLRPATPYAISHVAVERYAAYFETQRGVGNTILRFANVYGPGDLGRGGQGVIGTWLACAARGETATLIGSLSTERDYVYAEDAAGAVARVVAEDVRGTYNVGSSVAVSLEDVLAAVTSVVGVPLELDLDLRQHVTAHVPRTRLDCGRLRSDVGWAPEVDLKDGIQRTWEWTCEHAAFASPLAASGGG